MTGKRTFAAVTRCVNCGNPKVNRPRGLCWSCWHKPAVRAATPLIRVASNRRSPVGPDLYSSAPLPASPTPQRPGTPEKVAAMPDRAMRREQLFHPLDGLC